MKFKWDKKYLYWGATALVVLSITVLFNFLLQNNLAIRNAAVTLVKICLPIILGFIIAFLVNPLMKMMRNVVLRTARLRVCFFLRVGAAETRLVE